MTNEEYLVFKAGIDREMKEMYANTLALFAKTDEEFKETRTFINETDEQIKKISEHLDRTDEQIKRTSEHLDRTDQQMKRTDATLERMGINLGSITNNNGSITEEYFFNAMTEKPMLGGVKYDKVERNIKGNFSKVRDEFDIVLYNGDAIALIECKSKAHENDLVKLIEKKASNFKQLFPYYKNYKIYLGLASFCFYDSLEEMAKFNGVAVLKQKGDVLVIEADNLKVY